MVCIVELKNKVPTVVGYAHSMEKKTVESVLGTKKVMFATYENSPVWARTEEVKEIESYWDGKYVDPVKHFT